MPKFPKNTKKARGNDKEAAANVAILEKLIPHLDDGKPANLLSLDDEDSKRLASFCLLSSKPMLYACNVKEDELANASDQPHASKLQSWAAEQQDAGSCIISAKMEEELSELGEADIAEYLKQSGVSDSGSFNLNSIKLRHTALPPF